MSLSEFGFGLLRIIWLVTWCSMLVMASSSRSSAEDGRGCSSIPVRPVGKRSASGLGAGSC